jgi:hypothetical protein
VLEPHDPEGKEPGEKVEGDGAPAEQVASGSRVDP